MEIPYKVKAREDTGLWNAKIGMWLFLASEVMLFGGFFSGYVFLRMGSEYPWPEGIQNWKLGAFNTAVLIVSSVTVVFAWVSLKLSNYKHYVLYLSATVVCALLFLFLKLKHEYYKKLTHRVFVLNDQSMLAGHDFHGNAKSFKPGKSHGHHSKNSYNYFILKSLDLPTTNFNETTPNILRESSFSNNRDIILNYDVLDSKKLIGDRKVLASEQIDDKDLKSKEVIIHLNSYSDVEQFKDKVIVNTLKPVFNKKSIKLNDISSTWLVNQQERLKSENGVLSEFSKIKGNDLIKKVLEQRKTLFKDKIRFNFNKEIYCQLKKSNFDLINDNSININGVNFESKQVYGLVVDEIDLSRVVIFNNDESIDEIRTFDNKLNSLALNKLKNNDKYKENIINLRKTWNEDRTKKLNFRKVDSAKIKDYKSQELVFIPKDIVWKKTNYGPSLNNYMGIYYTITGLHGLHVLGGAIAFIFFIIRGKKWYKEDKELLTNRIEVTGLFWHFVDLVWIFAFPIFYLF